ncbi:MAG: molybdenum ABC transporter ATP-binding protein [Pseudomonadota bacterium]
MIDNNDNNIRIKFRLDRGDFVLDVDMSIPGRGVTAVFGFSGCGKTTLLRAIAGLEPDCDGFLKINGMLWQDGKYFIAPHQRSLGYVFQEASLFSHLNVQQNLEYGAKRISASQRKVSLHRAIDLLGIGSLLKRKPHQLSGGEQQRVAIARSLAVSPKILLMDEPLAALDMSRKKEILPYLESLHDELEIPIIYVSHSADEVAHLADYLVLLNDGQVRATGPIAQMLTRLDIPLAHGDDAGALIKASVAKYDEKYNLTYLDFPGGSIAIAGNKLSLGHPVRLRVAARDVSLTLEHQSGTSILNIFPATIEELIPEGNAQMIVRISAGGIPLLSRVTLKSAALLGLKKGKSVFAQVKSVALLS